MPNQTSHAGCLLTVVAPPRVAVHVTKITSLWRLNLAEVGGRLDRRAPSGVATLGDILGKVVLPHSWWRQILQAYLSSLLLRALSLGLDLLPHFRPLGPHFSLPAHASNLKHSRICATSLRFTKPINYM